MLESKNKKKDPLQKIMSSVQVAEEGNRRKGIMDSNEIEQCIHDIVDWFERKGDLTASSLSTIGRVL